MGRVKRIIYTSGILGVILQAAHVVLHGSVGLQTGAREMSEKKDATRKMGKMAGGPALLKSPSRGSSQHIKEQRHSRQVLPQIVQTEFMPVDYQDFPLGPVECRIDSGQQCLLAAVILVRIYEQDKAQWNKNDLQQWVQYMLYAGVSHVYLYDNYNTNNESLEYWCRSTFSPVFLTYHDWSNHTPYSISNTQERAYQHAANNYGSKTVWQIAFDMDEYPFSPTDKKRGFLTRAVEHLSNTSQQTASELSVKNFLFLGKPGNQSLVIERLLRRMRKPANDLDKPIYRTDMLKACRVHHNLLAAGNSLDVPSNVLRMNHYWGARLQNWGDDTLSIVSRTVRDNSALAVARSFRAYIEQNVFI